MRATMTCPKKGFPLTVILLLLRGDATIMLLFDNKLDVNNFISKLHKDRTCETLRIFFV